MNLAEWWQANEALANEIQSALNGARLSPKVRAPFVSICGYLMRLVFTALALLSAFVTANVSAQSTYWSYGSSESFQSGVSVGSQASVYSPRTDTQFSISCTNGKITKIAYSNAAISDGNIAVQPGAALISDYVWTREAGTQNGWVLPSNNYQQLLAGMMRQDYLTLYYNTRGVAKSVVLPLGDFSLAAYRVRNFCDWSNYGITWSSEPTVRFSFTGLTGMWWNANEGGHGMSIIQSGTGGLFTVWYAYAQDKEPEWYVISGGKWVGANRWEAPMYRATGPWVGTTFDPKQVSLGTPGVATLEFPDGNTLNFSYSLPAAGLSGSKQLTRFTQF
jgi:hypothetical protein